MEPINTPFRSHLRSYIQIHFISFSQQMTFGLVSAIGIMIVEMILFIRRATQMEGAYEKKPTALQESNAQMRSGALRISKIPEKLSDSNYDNKGTTVEKKSLEKHEKDSNSNIASKKSN